MIEGETFSLVATVLPKDAEYDGVMWASSNASVASVNSGTVTAVKEGTATITASAGGKSSTCTVKVSAKVVTVTSITLDKTSLSMQVGETETITATVNPDNASDKSVVWGSSDVSVATVSDGTITAKKSGEAIISAKSGSCIAKCKVTITVSTESITLDKTSLSLVVGETAQLTATVKPDDATDKKVAWASSDESVAKVSNGKVTAVKSGKATITAKCGDKIAECAVTVTVPTGSVTLDKTTLSLAVGETEQLTATVKPDDATDKNVTWTSSDESVAKVVNGKVTAVKSGKATINAKCCDKTGGKTAECAVTVTVPVTSLTLDRTTLSLAVGETAQLTATVKPDDATDKNVSWTSSDEFVAKVDNGKVTAVKSGKATITAKCCDKTAGCAVTVTVPVSSVILDKTTLSLSVGETATLTATVKPDNATDKNVIWSSSNESVVKVDNGKVSSLMMGQATITAAIGNIVASCDVTVYQSDNVIIYTTTDKKVLKPYNENAFGSTMVSNTYIGDVGIITFEKPVTSIGDMAFYKIGKLKSIIIPNSVSTIGKSSFYLCTNLLSVKMSQNLSSIGDNAFYGCYSMKALTFPDNLQIIGSTAFYYCSHAFEKNTLILPKKLHTINSYAFQGCGLYNVIWPEGLINIGTAAFMSNDFKEITIPGSVYLEGGSFYGCESLTKVIFQEGIISVPWACFVKCQVLSEIILPSTIKRICNSAFEGCLILKNLYVKAIEPPFIEYGAFEGRTSTNLSIWVPRASVDAYKEKWSAYKDNIKAYDF